MLLNDEFPTREIELRAVDSSIRSRMEALYIEAFPRDERAPFRRLWRKAAAGKADFWSLNSGSEWIGMAYVVRHEDLAYLFYLAIDSAQRGKGYGTATLAALKKHYAGYRFFLALEQLDSSAPNYDQRLKRHAFYERCGLHDLPGHLKEASVIYAIMGTDGPIQPEEYAAMFDRYMGRLLRRVIDMRIIPDDRTGSISNNHISH